MQDGRCREMVLRKGNGGDANVSVVKRGRNGLKKKIIKGGGKRGEDRRDLRTQRQQHGKNKVVALLFVLHILFSP